MPPNNVRYDRLLKTVIVFITKSNAIAYLNRQNAQSLPWLNVNFTNTFSAVTTATTIVVIVTVTSTALVITVTALSVCPSPSLSLSSLPLVYPPPNRHPFL